MIFVAFYYGLSSHLRFLLSEIARVMITSRFPFQEVFFFYMLFHLFS